MMKINMGCGNRRLDGYLNVDKFSNASADLIVDLEATPWPWDTDSVSEIRFIHSLEHMGQDTKTFLNIIKETYRVCSNEANVIIHVPHPRHDNYIGDPTHVRPLTAQQFMLFDRKLNDMWKETKSSAATPLGHYLDVDFVIKDNQVLLDPYYQQQLQAGTLSIQEITKMARELNNVIAEVHLTLMVRK